MARPREFDETAALDAAVQHFWRHGYEATSVRGLANAMGMTNASLYNAFGGKRPLFKIAIGRYVETTIEAPIHRLECSMSSRQAISTFFDQIVNASLKDRDRKGCLLVNSVLELSRDDSDLDGAIVDVFDQIELFFRRTIVVGQRTHEIPPTHSANELARLLLGALLGIRVLARVRPSRALLEDIVRS